MFVTDTADGLEISEQRSQALLCEMIEAAGLAPDCWPLDTETATTLLRVAGYAVTADELRKLGAMGQVPAIQQWDARDVITAAGALEGRRQWQFTPSQHDPKKSQSRLALETQIIAGDAGRESLHRQLGKIDLRLALVMLTECDNREMREKLLSIVQANMFIKDGTIV